jgi:hypothetical protein
MRILHVILTMALFGILPRAVQAQATPTPQGEVTGVVIDSRTDRPLRGVRVSVDNLPLSTDTDLDGRFRLSVNVGPQVAKTPH